LLCKIQKPQQARFQTPVKDVSGRIQQEGKVGATRRVLDCWMKILPQPWTVAMEATIFSGWIYDYLLPHAAQIKVAHPLILRAITAAKKKNDQIDASKIADSSKRIGSGLFQPKCCHWIDASGSSSRNPDGDQRDCAKKQWCHDKGSGVPSLNSE
jgi:hypothetical protein